MRLVVLKRPGFQSQKYGMPTYVWKKNSYPSIFDTVHYNPVRLIVQKYGKSN